MLIDTHAHLNFNAYKDDADAVIRRSLDGDVWMINVGSQYSTSRRAVEIAERYEKGVYAATGLHPIHLAKGIFKTKADKEEVEFETHEEEFDSGKYRELAKSKKVVAIGEIGLDYYYRPKTKVKLEQVKNRQKQVFVKQLELAQELNLPVVLHCRMAHDELLEIISHKIKNANHKLSGVIHCFTGTWEQAQRYMELGFYIGFNGIIFKLNLDEVIEKTPLEKILIETDCPYLTPPLPAEILTKAGLPAEALAKAGPMDGKRNEPIFVKYVVQKIAELKKVSYNEIARTTTENAQKLFRI